MKSKNPVERWAIATQVIQFGLVKSGTSEYGLETAEKKCVK